MSSKYKIPIQIIELDEKSIHLIIEVKINGAPVNMIIDTGASRTIFALSLNGDKMTTPQSSDKEQIHSTGLMADNIRNIQVIAKSFKLGKLKLKNYPVVLIDLTGINSFYKKVAGLEISGLLGGDFLQEMKAVIDYSKAVLVLKKTKR